MMMVVVKLSRSLAAASLPEPFLMRNMDNGDDAGRVKTHGVQARACDGPLWQHTDYRVS